MKIIGSLKAVLGLDKTKYDRGLNQAEQRTNRFSAGIKRLAGFMAAAFSVTIIAGFLKKATQAFDVQAKANQALLVALKGRSDIQQNIIKQASQLQRITLFGDEQTIQAAARLAMMLGQDEQAIRRLLPLVQDLATAKFEGNLVTAAELVAKSVGSSTNALSRYGIVIEGAVGSAERLESTIEQLNKQVGSQSVAAANVGLGAVTQLKNSWGDLTEVIGESITKSKSFKTIIEGLKIIVDKLSSVLTKTNPFAGKNKTDLEAYRKSFEVAIESTWGRLEQAQKELNRLMNIHGSWMRQWKGMKEQEQIIRDSEDAISHYKDQIDMIDQSLKAFDDNADSVDGVTKTIEDLIKKIKEQAAEANKLAEAWNRVRAEIAGAMGAVGLKPIGTGNISTGELSSHSGQMNQLPGLQPFGGTAPSDTEKTNREIEGLTESLYEQQTAVNILASSFDALFSSAGDGFKAMIDVMINSLKRLIAEMLAKVVVLTILNVLTGGGASFANILQSASGLNFAKGASGGTVPSGYPNDTFPAMLSSGETILTEQQSRSFNNKILVEVRGDILGRGLAIQGRRTEIDN